MSVTLNYDLLSGHEPGTEDYGYARFAMVLDFAADSFLDSLYIFAKAKKQGKIESNTVTIRNLCKGVFNDLLEQDEELAEIWGQSWNQILGGGEMLLEWMKNWKGFVFFDQMDGDDIADFTLYLDFDALKMAAMLEDVKSAWKTTSFTLNSTSRWGA